MRKSFKSFDKLKKILVLLSIFFTFDVYSANYGATKLGLYYSVAGNWYHGYTYELPNFFDWIVIDVGYLVSIDSKDKSYSIAALGLDLQNIFPKMKNKVINIEPGCWAGYDVANETDEKIAWGVKINLIDYAF